MPDGSGGYVIPATYTDVQIDKDGTYKVGITDFDWALDSASAFNLLFLSTRTQAKTVNLSLSSLTARLSLTVQ